MHWGFRELALSLRAVSIVVCLLPFLLSMLAQIRAVTSLPVESWDAWILGCLDAGTVGRCPLADGVGYVVAAPEL